MLRVKNNYKTDFASEFARWAGYRPSEDMMKATYKEQQAALAFLREMSHIKLIINRGKTKKTHTKEKVRKAIK